MDHPPHNKTYNSPSDLQVNLIKGHPVSRLFPHVHTVHATDIYIVYNLTTLRLIVTLSCVDFVDVIMGDIAVTQTTSGQWRGFPIHTMDRHCM